MVKQKHAEKIELMKQKVADLHYLGNILSRVPGDFVHQYPHPDFIPMANADEEEEEEAEEEEADFEFEEYIHACHEYNSEDDTESE